jgi:biopolymer transport protein ExbD
MSHRIRRLRKRPAELDITAFMNMIVVLVPFLLTTTVFTRLAVLELNLPAQSSGFTSLKGDLQLEVVIRKDGLEVGDRLGGLIRRIDGTAKGYDFASLSQLMLQLKQRFPDKNEVTILAEADTPYEVLVQTMDAVRVTKTLQDGHVAKVDLFPEVSIGDAPVAVAQAAAHGPRTGKKP